MNSLIDVFKALAAQWWPWVLHAPRLSRGGIAVTVALAAAVLPGLRTGYAPAVADDAGEVSATTGTVRTAPGDAGATPEPAGPGGDESGLPGLTQFTFREGDEWEPAWSPDGRWIAYTAATARQPRGGWEIWIKPVSGGEATQLTKHPDMDRYASWAPGGTQLAFASNRGGAANIWIIPASGGEPRRVTADEDLVTDVQESMVSWSPDGSKIAFASDRGGGTIWMIPAIGGAARQLAPIHAPAGYPSWSPDGQWIAYSLGLPGRMDIWIAPVSGGAPRQVTTGPMDEWTPEWSPDGRWLAFRSGERDIWIVPASGGIPVPLANTPQDGEFAPAWSPDGTRIAFSSLPARQATPVPPDSLRAGQRRPSRNSDIWIAEASHVATLVGQVTHQRLAGQVTHRRDQRPLANVVIRVRDEEGTVRHRAMTSSDGRYDAWAAPGTYVISAARGNGADSVTVALAAGGQVEGIDFAVTPIEPPKALARAGAVYRALRGYRDSTYVQTRTVRPGEYRETTTPTALALERPNRLRLESTNWAMGGVAVVVCDGMMLVNYSEGPHLEGKRQYVQKKAPGRLTPADLRGRLPGPTHGFVQQLLLSDDPLKVLMEGVEEAKEVRPHRPLWRRALVAVLRPLGLFRARLDGTPVTTIQLTRPASSLPPGTVPYVRPDVDASVSMRIWIGDEGYLIRQVVIEVDLAPMIEAFPEEQRVWMPRRVTLIERHTATELDPAFSAESFTFVAPEGARLVGDFEIGGRRRAKADMVGQPAPGFVLRDVEDQEVEWADFEGKVVIVDFWATWCGPCRTEMPAFVALQEQYQTEGFSVVAIAVDDTADKVRSYAAQQELNFPLLMGDDEVRQAFGHISGLPTSFVIDKKGIVRYAYVGTPSDMLAFQRHVEELLAE